MSDKATRLDRAMKHPSVAQARQQQQEQQSVQQQQLAETQLASLSSADKQALEALRVAALPLGQLVDHLLDLLDIGVDAETGEVNAVVEDVLESLNLSIQAKVQAYAHVVDRLNAESKSLLELADRYKAKADVRATTSKRIKARLQGELERLGTDKIKTPTVVAYLQNSPPSVELTVLNDEEIPDEYCVVERRVSTSKIATALKAGTVLAFATLTQSKHLRFR